LLPNCLSMWHALRELARVLCQQVTAQEGPEKRPN